MKFIKGCFITLLLFIAIFFGGYFFFKNNVVNNLEVLNNDVNQKWREYTNVLKERNIQLSKQNAQNDSLKYYLEKGKSISLSKCSKELEFNEYKINKFVINDYIHSDLNSKINLKLDAYNQYVRSYNIYRITFPNSLIASKYNFPKKFIYFDIRYGVDNENTMLKKKKREDWVKNGDPYPE